jgi:hypothetical protein
VRGPRGGRGGLVGRRLGGCVSPFRVRDLVTGGFTVAKVVARALVFGKP